jgi:hypothetical protein
MQNALQDATHRGIQNVPLIAPARRPIEASDSNRTVKSECLEFHKKQQARQSRVNGSLIGKGN